jgi:hypothetical protein
MSSDVRRSAASGQVGIREPRNIAWPVVSALIDNRDLFLGEVVASTPPLPVLAQEFTQQYECLELYLHDLRPRSDSHCGAGDESSLSSFRNGSTDRFSQCASQER